MCTYNDIKIEENHLTEDDDSAVLAVDVLSLVGNSFPGMTATAFVSICL
jgi:rRNA processing protein Krr1/Pno1